MNKRIIVASLLAAGALSMWGLTAVGSGQPASHDASDQVFADGPVVSVSAVGSVALPPDQVTMTIGTQAEAPTANEAISEVTTVIKGLSEQIRSLDLPGVSIQIEMVQAWPKIRQGGRGASIEITGFNATQSLSLNMENLNSLSQVYDLADESGAEQIGGLVFSIKNQDEIKDQAMRLAVRRGMKKVRAIADEMGMSEVQWQSIEEVQLQNPDERRIAVSRNFSPYPSGRSMSINVTAKIDLVARLGHGNEPDTHGKHE
jgi:uncharacterized protein YggE